jgi:hypothetical protein
MTPDPRPQANPDHAHDERGQLVYDIRCWWCRWAADPHGLVTAALAEVGR